MVFIDHKNFTANFDCIKEERNQDRWIDFYKIGSFVTDFLSNNHQYRGHPLMHIRTYLYTGQYTEQLMKRIKDEIDKTPNTTKKVELQTLFGKASKKKDAQKIFLEETKIYHYFEVRLKPLQFSSNRVVQKGVDVQLAVDLVTNAYLNTYDIAVVFSGDVDLLESIKTVKNLGKHVIIFSHHHNIAKDMIKESDMFVDFQKLKDEHLDKISHVFEQHSKTSPAISTLSKPNQ